MVTDQHEKPDHPRTAPGSDPAGPVGIMADSHGQAESIERALALFQRINCRQIYHLGDICDSFRAETADACVRLLQAENIIALKGNNDHALVVVQSDAPTPDVSPGTITYLGQLPLTARAGNAVFAHSLPFVQELGHSCMIRTPQEHETQWFFSAFPSGILFRGHSHEPEIRQRRNGKLITQSIGAGQSVTLGKHNPGIVTCGALIRGLCMVFYSVDNTIVSYSIDA